MCGGTVGVMCEISFNVSGTGLIPGCAWGTDSGGSAIVGCAGGG